MKSPKDCWTLFFWSQVVRAQILHCQGPCPGSRAPSGAFGGRPDGYWQWNWCQSKVDTRTTAVCPLPTKGHALAAILFHWISHPSKLYEVAHKPMICHKSFKIRRGKRWIDMLPAVPQVNQGGRPASQVGRSRLVGLSSLHYTIHLSPVGPPPICWQSWLEKNKNIIYIFSDFLQPSYTIPLFHISAASQSWKKWKIFLYFCSFLKLHILFSAANHHSYEYR